MERLRPNIHTRTAHKATSSTPPPPLPPWAMIIPYEAVRARARLSWNPLIYIIESISTSGFLTVGYGEISVNSTKAENFKRRTGSRNHPSNFSVTKSLKKVVTLVITQQMKFCRKQRVIRPFANSVSKPKPRVSPGRGGGLKPMNLPPPLAAMPEEFIRIGGSGRH